MFVIILPLAIAVPSACDRSDGQDTLANEGVSRDGETSRIGKRTVRRGLVDDTRLRAPYAATLLVLFQAQQHLIFR